MLADTKYNKIGYAVEVYCLLGNLSVYIDSLYLFDLRLQRIRKRRSGQAIVLWLWYLYGIYISQRSQCKHKGGRMSEAVFYLNYFPLDNTYSVLL